jgi:aerobic carbon-monoxide dehydrogenase small subunit
MSATPIRLNVNGEDHDILIPHRKLLADVLREDCGLNGTHVGCEHGVCGACTVLVDGAPLRACLAFGVQMSDRTITTVESLTVEGKYHPLQQALHQYHGLQCGFCTAGILMTFVAYLKANPEPTEEEIRDVLAGNLCRCTGYHNIVIAIQSAARAMRESAK